MNSKKKKLSQYYTFDWYRGGTHSFVLRGKDSDNRIKNKISAEMKRIAQNIWGWGGVGNQIFTGSLEPHFNSFDRELNIKRAKLVTSVWRYCKRNNIIINKKNKNVILEIAKKLNKDDLSLNIYKVKKDL